MVPVFVRQIRVVFPPSRSGEVLGNLTFPALHQSLMVLSPRRTDLADSDFSEENFVIVYKSIPLWANLILIPSVRTSDLLSTFGFTLRLSLRSGPLPVTPTLPPCSPPNSPMMFEQDHRYVTPSATANHAVSVGEILSFPSSRGFPPLHPSSSFNERERQKLAFRLFPLRPSRFSQSSAH